jgi:hypothetical protein
MQPVEWIHPWNLEQAFIVLSYGVKVSWEIVCI